MFCRFCQLYRKPVEPVLNVSDFMSDIAVLAPFLIAIVFNQGITNILEVLISLNELYDHCF